jgi:hypothetical protein
LISSYYCSTGLLCKEFLALDSAAVRKTGQLFTFNQSVRNQQILANMVLQTAALCQESHKRASSTCFCTVFLDRRTPVAARPT